MASRKKSPPKPIGRPSKFTPTVRKVLIDGITAGLTYKHVCQIAGIDYESFNNWRKIGEALDEPDDEGYFDFFVALTRAESNASLSMMATIRKVAQGYKIKRPFTDRAGRIVTDRDGNPVLIDDEILADWRASAWWLERRYPEEYGKTRTEVTGVDGGTIRFEIVRRDSDEDDHSS